ncbi:MAG: ATPase [Chloroflexi bacterium]|nr:ATPase [Chloroflexota bacterium]
MGGRGTATDVLHLISRLEALVASGWRLPGSSKTLIDGEEFLDLVDQLQVSLPEELRLAKKVAQERERMLEEAGAEAEQIRAEARRQAAALLSEEGLAEEAQRKAEQIRLGADNYAYEVLTKLENELAKILASVRKGRVALQGAAGGDARTGQVVEERDEKASPLELGRQ